MAVGPSSDAERTDYRTVYGSCLFPDEFAGSRNHDSHLIEFVVAVNRPITAERFLTVWKKRTKTRDTPRKSLPDAALQTVRCMA